MNRRKKHMPLILRIALFFILPYDDMSNLNGDFEELYFYKSKIKGKVNAFCWLIFQILLSAPGFVINKIYWGITMFKNYLLTTIRNIKRQKLNSTLNVLGLALAIACCLIIYTHIRYELGYEECYPKAERIYRIDIDSKFGNTIRNWTNVPVPLGPTLKETFPAIQDYARITDRLGTMVLKYQTPLGQVKTFEEKNGFFTDPSIISIFDLNFISGDPNTALDNIGSIVLSESTAHKYFGNENPVGKTVINLNTKQSLTVTGVIQDMPENTHLQFDLLVSINTWFKILADIGISDWTQSRSWKALKTYVLLEPGSSIEALRLKMSEFQKQFQTDGPNREEKFLLQPITEIHLYSHRENELTPNSDITNIYIFSIIGIFILVIAAVNFINISLAQAFKRFKEVGIRKVMGAHKKQIFNQFLGESFVLTFIATLLSFLLIGIFLPVYNHLAGKHLLFGQIFSPGNLALLIGLVILTTLTVGFYPSVFISKLPTSSSFSNFKNPKSSVSLIRKGLVIFQFVISIFMILSTITVYQQLQYFNEKDLGFDKSGLIGVQLYGDLRKIIKNTGDVLKKKLENYTSITGISNTSNLPGENLSIEHLFPEGKNKEELPTMRFLRVDENYINTMEIRLLSGQNFTQYSGSDKRFIINEAAAKALELKNPIGTKCESYFGAGEIIGVIQDYNYESLHSSIEPLVLEYNPGWSNYLILRCTGKNVKDVIEYAEAEFKKVAPDHLFNYSFVSNDLERLYNLETNLSEVFQLFAILSILISCLGLFGLSVYTTELKIKEIGIRKVLGATTTGITTLLSREFIFWVTIANIIAWPCAYYFMDKWLNNFAYRIDINYWIFIAGGLLSLGIALLTVSYQSLRAALSNPVESLRTE